MDKEKYRVESDLLGDREVPADAYYGVQTVRAKENFRISGHLLSDYANFIRGMALTKKAAAMANVEVGMISAEQGEAIEWACDRLIEGKHHEEFPIDMIQGGAGTSTNMAANEVIANLALEHMGHRKGEYQYCSPNDVVKLGIILFIAWFMGERPGRSKSFLLGILPVIGTASCSCVRPIFTTWANSLRL